MPAAGLEATEGPDEVSEHPEQAALFPDTVGLPHCQHCGADWKRGEEPDPCLGYLPDVAGACCGHGDREPYVDLQAAWNEAIAATAGHWEHERWRTIISRHRLTGPQALAYFAQHNCGPKSQSE